MRLRVLVPLLLALAAVLGLVIGAVLPSSGGGAATPAPSVSTPGTGSGSPAVDPSGDPSDTPSEEPSSESPSAQPTSNPNSDFAVIGEGGGAAAENQPQPTFPVTKLKAGEKPPQFVIVSFDGACKDELFQHYMDVAERNNAHYTFFLTGLCILPEEDRFLYQPPGKPAGSSAVGFADATLVAQRIVNWSRAYNEGHEIGTHFLGHFCDEAGVQTWDAAGWRSEIEQFNGIIDNWASINKVSNPTPFPFNSSIVKGGRTPCLAGQRDEMYPVFTDFGYVYDSSNGGDLEWPRKNSYGLWDFPLQTIKISGYGRNQLSMDYNFLYTQNNASVTADQATCDKIEESTYQSFIDALDAVYNGNRAPFLIGNHFNEWVCGAYKNALTRFIDDATANYPDVKFVTNMDLVRWLDAQDPSTISRLQGLGIQDY